MTRVWLLAAVLWLAASTARADDEPEQLLRFSYGSRPGEHLELALDLWLPSLKKTSDFGFGVGRAGQRAPRFVQDLGFPEEQTAYLAFAAVNVGPFGWVGGEVSGFGYRDAVGVVSRPRQVDGVELARGDVTETSATWLWGRLHYGFELRWRLADLVDLSVSPTLGLGLYHLDVKTRRLLPQPGPRAGGSQTAWVVAPGARLAVEVLDAVRLGCDLEWLPGVKGELAVAPSHAVEWERVRVYLGVRFFGVEATVGYRYVNTSAEGGGRTSDVKLRGVDFSLGVRF